MQCTKIAAFKYSFKKISWGVPQASVITPLRFLIYVNDITQPSSFNTTLFADDINNQMPTFCFDIHQATVNLQLYKIDSWFRDN